jgi:hypothetical protein
MAACDVETRCQDLNWNSTQTTEVVRLTPNFVDHLVMLIKHDCLKKVTFQDICSVDPFWQIGCLYEDPQMLVVQHDLAGNPEHIGLELDVQQ